MFTGIIEDIGTVKKISDNSIVVTYNSFDDIKIGDSISVNGVCLTITDFDKNQLTFDISPETFKVTMFKTLSTGDRVNLERAMLATSRFGGHIVTGHIDCVSRVANIEKSNNFYNLKIFIEQPQYQNYVVKKGSVAINGISLTICNIYDKYICMSIIPHTYEHTNLCDLKKNSIVNIEFDILAKYIEKNTRVSDNSRITEDFLANNGFM